jgi:hypothetical protein
MHHRGQLMLIQRMLGQLPHLTRQMQERMAAAAARASHPSPHALAFTTRNRKNREFLLKNSSALALCPPW